MIKTNLLKSKVPIDDRGGSQEYIFDSGSDSDSQNEQIVKFLSVIIFTLMIIGYEYYNIGTLEDKKRSLNVQLEGLNTTLTDLKSKTGNVEEVVKETGIIEEKIDLIQSLSSKRLKELKALDYLQNIIPDGIWLKKVDYDGDKATINGTAMTDRDLNVFVEKLENSNYYQDVLLMRSQKDEKESGTYKNFELSSAIGDVQ